MKTLSQSIRICSYQLCILSRNYKIYTLPVCLFIFMWNVLEPFRTFLATVHTDASPFLFPFLFSDEFLCALMFAGILLFFTDAPFYNEHQLFVIMRSQISRWTLGQIFYVLTVSALYMCFLLVMSVLMLVPYISFNTEWGKVWTTLAVTGAGYDFSLSFHVTKSVIFDYTPLQAVLLTFVVGVLICSLYGFCMWCLNLYLGKNLSLVLVLASVCLVTRIRFLPAWLTYLTPSRWADLANLYEYARHGLSVPKTIRILIAGNVFFAALAFYRTAHSDIAG